MRYIKRYNESVENYTIYDWFEELKGFEWGGNTHVPSQLKEKSDQFIGKGYYEKVINKVDSFFSAFEKADIEYVEQRMWEVYDHVPVEKKKDVFFAVIYGDYEKHDETNLQSKYSGSLPQKFHKKSKTRLIIHILKSIIYPTLYIGHPSIRLRAIGKESNITDEKYNCSNFDIKNYSIEVGDELYNTEGRKSKIFQSDISKKEKYSVDKVLDMYKPAIYIDIGSQTVGDNTHTMNLKKLEANIDETLESILPALDYEDVVFDMSRGLRKYSDDMNIYEYSFKIILK